MQYSKIGFDVYLSAMNLTPAQFQTLQTLWVEEIGEELTPEKTEEYGGRVLALVALVARSKRLPVPQG